MKKWKLLPRAISDLDEIWVYGANRWDRDQADSYLRSLNLAFERIGDGRVAGHKLPSKHTGFRQYRVTSHFVVFRKVDQLVEIARILHVRMDADRHILL